MKGAKGRDYEKNIATVLTGQLTFLILYKPALFLGGDMENNSTIQEAIRIRGKIYDILQALVAEHGIGMVLSVFEDVCFIQATSLKIHDKCIDKAKSWNKIGRQLAKIVSDL